jgi:hypothetical protein
MWEMYWKKGKQNALLVVLPPPPPSTVPEKAIKSEDHLNTTQYINMYTGTVQIKIHNGMGQ